MPCVLPDIRPPLSCQYPSSNIRSKSEQLRETNTFDEIRNKLRKINLSVTLAFYAVRPQCLEDANALLTSL